MPIPVAIVLNSYEHGGTEYQMTELIRRLDRAVFTVHSVCLGDRGSLRPRVAEAAATMTEFPLRGFASWNTPAQMWKFARWCRERHIQVVHACDFYANVMTLAPAAFARVPVRIGSRRDVFIPERTPMQHRAQRLAYRFAHRIVANSAAAAARLVEEGVPRARVLEIPNGLDLDRFAPPSRPAGRPVVTTVANLRPGKGHDVLLKAAAIVARHVPSVLFRIAGDGSQRDRLMREAARLEVTGHVRFDGHCEDVPATLAESHIFAFPSFMEAAPNAVLEAMAAGLPIVATDVGGIPEVVEHGRNGLLVPAGDEQALASAIIRLLESPALASTLAVAARATVDARFSFARMTAAFERLYLDELAVRTEGAPLAWASER